MFGRRINWEQIAGQLDSEKTGKREHHDDEETILENMRRGRLKTWVSSLLVSLTLNMSALGKMGSLKGDWVMDKYAEKKKDSVLKEEVNFDFLIKIEGKIDLEKIAETKKYNDFVSVEDAEENPDALIKIYKDNPLAGLEDLSLKDRERVDIATFDLRREYHKGDLKLEDLEDREKMFDQLVEWFIENSKKDESNKIDFYKLLENLTKQEFPLVDKYEYDENASRLSQALNRKDSRSDCDATSLLQLAILQRVYNYDPSLKNNFEFYKARRSADKKGKGHSFVLILVKNTGTWISLQRIFVELLREEDRKYTEAHRISAFVSAVFGEAEEEYLHKSEEMPILEPEEIETFDEKAQENVLTREISNINLPTYPGNNAEEERSPTEDTEIKRQLLTEVAEAISTNVVLSPAVNEYNKQIRELLIVLDEAKDDQSRKEAGSEIIKLFNELDGDIYIAVADLNPKFAIISLQDYLERFRGEFGVELRKKISTDKHNIDLEELPEAIPVPIQKEDESDEDFRNRLEGYIKLYRDQVKLYQIRAIDEISKIKEKYNIPDFFDDILKYSELLKVLERYEKNGTRKSLDLLVDVYPDKYLFLKSLLISYDKNKDASTGENKTDLESLLVEEKKHPDDVDLLLSIAKLYQGRGNIEKMLEYCKRIIFLGNLNAKDILLMEYYQGNLNEHLVGFSEIMSEIEKQEILFHDEEYQAKNDEEKIIFWENYLETLRIFGGQISDKYFLEMRILGSNVAKIYVDTKTSTEQITRMAKLFGDIFFERAYYLQSAKYYMTVLAGNKELMPDDHITAMVDNSENIFPQEVSDYLTKEITSIMDDFEINFEDLIDNKYISDKTRINEVIRYYNLWIIMSAKKEFDPKLLNFIHNALQNSFYVRKNADVERKLLGILEIIKELKYESFRNRAQEIEDAVYKPDEKANK